MSEDLKKKPVSQEIVTIPDGKHTVKGPLAVPDGVTLVVEGELTVKDEPLEDQFKRVFGKELVKVREEAPASGTLPKLQALEGLAKLTALFADLEQQGLVGKGTTASLDDHFTESAWTEPVPEDSPPIKWEGRKYELVRLLRRLWGWEWLGATDEKIEPHFVLMHKDNAKPFKMRKVSFRSTDKLSRIDEILKRHS